MTAEGITMRPIPDASGIGLYVDIGSLDYRFGEHVCADGAVIGWAHDGTQGVMFLKGPRETPHEG